MSFGSLLSWWHWVILGIIPFAIIALYFLKLKRQPLEVPSTYLWKKSIEDLHVNSLWQKMRQSLLLFLQLLFVAIVIFALTRPYWESTRLQGERFIFLIDNSASMAATDVEAGSKRTRLDEVKRRVSELIERLKSGDAALIASFSDTARVEQQFTENRGDLLRALKAIPQTNRPTAILEALRMADGTANPRRSGDRNAGDFAVADAMPAELYIYSDGKFADVPDFALGNLTPTYVPIGNANAENLGITAFSVRRNDNKLDRLQAFFQVDNFGTTAVTTNVELYLNDDKSVLDTKQITVEPGKSVGDVFDLADLETGTLRLALPRPDSFPVDNIAYAVVGANRRSRVLVVTANDDALELALKTAKVQRRAEVTLVKPAYLTTDEYTKVAAAGEYDLIMFDRCAPKTSPLSNTLYIGALPPENWKSETKIAAPAIIDTDHAHPLMQAVEFGDVIIGEGMSLTPPRGMTRLIETQKGTMAAIAPRDGYEDVVLGFELYGVEADGAKYANTNWTVKLSFPVFVLNAVNYLGSRQGATDPTAFQPGKPVPLSRDFGGTQLRVKSPAGRGTQVPRDNAGRFQFTGADELGVYQFGPADKLDGQFAVNLFDRAESDIRPRPENSIKIGHEKVEGKAGVEPTRREGWRWLAFAALGVLIFEWYIYNKRVYL